MKKVLAVVGARPQFIKHFPIEQAALEIFQLRTIHTGQHYDKRMSQVFFDELGMRKPDFQLSIGSASHAKQTGQMMIEIEPIIVLEKPDAVLVYGDTNSTIAGALVAGKLNIPIIHVEAGLRSFNMSMPEEVNRILTDRISSILFVPVESARENLLGEGISSERIHVVGDVMRDIMRICLQRNLVASRKPSFYYATIHRPYNTDVKERLVAIFKSLNRLGNRVTFSLHPRTRALMASFQIDFVDYNNIDFIEPQSYLENLSYLNSCKALITDSGGMQKEAYWLKKKCVTIRSETEWRETLASGCNELVFDDFAHLEPALNRRPKEWKDDLYGNGKAARQMCRIIAEQL